jgi:photosystem II stability/assembly factor-like uncharacterized protein
MINERINYILYISEFLIMLFVLILSPIFINGITLGVDEYDVTAKAQEDKTWEILNHAYIDADTVFYDIKFLNETHGWVVGDIGSTIHKGVVLHTNDSGDTWFLQLYRISHDFVQIEIIDANNIWVAGIGSLFHTSNGGFTWDEYPVVETRSGLSTVEFVNLTHGWTATKNDLFYTQDGGITWVNNTSWKFNDVPRQMYFVTSLDVWAIGFYGIYQSIDGGYTWTQRYDRGGWSMSFISDNEAWAVADDMLVHMTDGITWMEQNMPRPSSSSGLQYPYFTDVVFKDKNHGWLVGLETPVAYTPDGGVTWYEQSAQVEPRQRVMAVDFLNQTHGWAAGYNGLIMRTHRGDSTDIPLTTNVDKPDISILISISMVSIVAIVLFIIYRKVTN